MKPLPTSAKVTEFLRQLTGKAPVVKPAKPGSFGQAGLPAFAGIYTVDGEAQPEAAIVVDLGVALGLVGAFTMTPAGVILENLKKKECTEMVPPTIYEILNVSASMLNANGAAHVRLTEMVQFSGKPSGPVADLLTKAAQRLELEAAVTPCPASYLSIARV